MIKSNIEVTLIDLAWTAGFIDGEGCITSSGTGVTVKVSHTHLPSLQYLQETFGGYLHSRKGTHKPAWVWAVHGDDAAHLLHLLIPYLKEKRTQATVAMNILLLRTGRGIKPNYEIAEQRDKLRKELAELKK